MQNALEQCVHVRQLWKDSLKFKQQQIFECLNLGKVSGCNLMVEKKLKREKNYLHVQRHVAHHLHSTLNLTVSWKRILGQLRLSLKQLLSLSSRAPVQIQYNIPEGFMCALTSLLKLGPYLILNSHLSLVSRSMFLQDKSQYCMCRSSAFITLCCCSALALLEGCCMSLVMHSVH